MRKLDHKSQTFKVYGLESGGRSTPSHQRIWVMLIGLVFVFFALGWRLFHLQVVMGAEYRSRSDNNRIVELRIPAARGIMYDKNGIPLVTNHPVTQSLTTTEGILLSEGPTLSRDEVLLLESTSSGKIKTSIGRFYPYHKYAAHLLGYVNEANEEDLLSQTVVAGEMYGRAGLEKEFNSVLTGLAGSEILELDARGKVLRQFPQKSPQPGTDLYLHLDIKLQQKLAELLDGRPGAAIASNPQTGAILALVSSPSFDPNTFGYLPEEMGIKDYKVTDDISYLLTSETRPLMNRTIGGSYPPASVYKVVTSIAALEKEVIQADTEVEDNGKITIDQYEFRNWYYTKYGGRDGMVNLKLALQRSNDIYYYKVGEWVGIDTLSSWSRLFGLGSPTNIQLPGEVSGLVPDPVWKEKYKGERWFLGNTYHMAIGQGDLLVTPLQQHQMMGVIANNGRLCKPLLVSKIGDKAQPGAECKELGIDPAHIEAVKQGLIAACAPGGTGLPFFTYKLSEKNSRFDENDQIACKTGTAQFYDKENRTHAWFSMFAPSENPEIMITVLLEAAGEGSEKAAPVAKEALDFWLAN